MSANPLNVTLNKQWLLIVASIFFVLIIIAATGLSNKVSTNYETIPNIKYLVDSTNQYDINSIKRVMNSEWKNHDEYSINMGVSEGIYWFKSTLNDIDINRSWLLQLDYVMLDRVSLWFVQNENTLTEYHVGDTLPFSQRAVEHETFLFPVPNNASSVQVFIKVYSKGIIRVPIKIWENNDYLTFASENEMALGLFFGLMLAMGLSNFFFFITSRASVFLVYSCYVMCLGLTLAVLNGQGYRYLWPNMPWLQQHAVGIFASLTVYLSIIFCDRLLRVKIHSPTLSRILNGTAYLFIVGLVISLFMPLQIFLQIFLLLLTTAEIFVLGVAIWLWYKGESIARFYTLAWAVLFISVFLLSLDNLNIIEVNFPTYYLLMLGAAIETVFLALILAISHNQQRQALLDTQADLLNKERQTQHAQKDMLELQENATEELEYKVQERTLELEIALRELSETNRELEEKNTLDALTGIRNRSYFDKKYQAEVRRSRREQTQLSVVMLDIDHFKKVNDGYGHLVGDQCIKAVADILKNALKRPSDDVCRYGGEEFALILPSTNLEGALVLVEQLRAKIEATNIQTDNVSVSITISAGIGTAVTSLNQPEDVILALADKQLYVAKNAGRNNVQGANLDVIQNQD